MDIGIAMGILSFLGFQCGSWDYSIDAGFLVSILGFRFDWDSSEYSDIPV